MKAIRFHSHGGVDVLRDEDAPDPEPAAGEVLVRVRACALNHVDLWERRGLPRVAVPMPHISGSDVAGEVVGTGRRVMLQAGISCGRCAACLSGRDNECPLCSCRRLSVDVRDRMAHARTRAQIARGEDVLILAAGSEIKVHTNNRGVDVVIEHVGESTWPKGVRALARGGRLVTCGATTGPKESLDLAALFSKQLSILGSYMGTKGELWQAARDFFSGQLAPVIDRTFPLSDAARAQERLEASGQFGKIVLEV
jgi:NADPH:quinone reductase-like Zn-dependent oxidoreductase